MDGLQTPVALFLFNRPGPTRRVMSCIARQRPRTLLLIADGPRNADEQCLTDAARDALGRIDWPCDVRINFSDQNLGCRRRMSSGIDWVFSQVPEAILLEDDCLPDDSFFPFCTELLQRYRDDDRVMMISGNNFQQGQRVGEAGYYFSAITHIWGWATWRRAWKQYDVQMSRWPELRDGSLLDELLPEPRVASYFRRVLDDIHDGKVDTWDLQWQFTAWAHGGLAVLPQTNLVTNLGFGPDATHTRKATKYAQMKTEPMKFPLAHPIQAIRQVEADMRSLLEMVGLRAV
jgi:hypothetical protein